MTTRRSLLLAGSALVAAPSVASAGPAEDLRSYERFVAAQAAQDKFSGTVLLAHRGKPVLVRSYGMADQSKAIPNGKDTVFCLASISKVFTAVAVAQLAQQGRLAFHDPLRTYLDGFPDKVTLHHLLTHTSGLGRPSQGGGAPPAWQSFDEALAGTLDIVRSTPPQFTPPGTEHRYSNDGFWVLAGVVARVTGTSFFDYVRDHVFRPAGMTRTDYHSKPQVQASAQIARPYWTRPSGGRVDALTTPFFPFTNGPAGGVYSTVSDLLAFVTSYGKVLNRPFADVITSGKVALPAGTSPVRANFYGYGHIDAIWRDQRVFGHSGSGPGMATRLDVFPYGDWVSIILSNYDTSIDPIVTAARDLLTS
ncbi:serine hydrolase [Kibdelosporangium persicum]|uniref:Beta-lactamase class C n=1 Tax=Kibdelosporangium persicum TaxID=2698649 RepID=A0ABX2EWA4_9PSEU|nr:serine hydrolase domain-containing protein [Kibdelosporangium persicum]NRN63000.1 Beta-lactamase class C [Kibdelosporangium persicum]